MPQANLALISLPGRYAGREAKLALERGLNVFLFSSNVPPKEEIALKQLAAENGLIVMGPDCGTAILAGAGSGVSHALGAGSRDFSDAVGGITALSAFEALEADDQTAVIVLLAKPPGPKTLARLAERIKRAQKPVVSRFLRIVPAEIRRAWPGKLVTVIDEANDPEVAVLLLDFVLGR